VALEVRKCEECARYHRGNAPKQTPLNPFHAGEPWEVISIDITGRHPKSRRGNEYIVTVVDLFTRWAEAVPVRNHTAEVVARVLLDKVINRFGTPLRILSDQGREFESTLFRELCEKLEIDKVRTSPYQSSTNCVVECFHRTLNSMLAKVISDNQRDWCERLESVMAAYRAGKHELTPNFLVFGRENRMPIDLLLGPIQETDEDPASKRSYDDFVEQQIEVFEEAYQLARQHLGNSAKRRKIEYDLRVKTKDFEVGQFVWYFYPRRYQKRSPKWSKSYDGPFLIIKKIPPCDFVIQRTKKSRPIVVRANKLKMCEYSTPPSWLKSLDMQPAEPTLVIELVEATEPVIPLETRDSMSAGDDRPVIPGHSKVDFGKSQRKRSRRNEEFDETAQAVEEVIKKRKSRPPQWLQDYEY